MLELRGQKLVLNPNQRYFQITSLDVSSGGIGISAGNDGMFVWEAQNGLVRVSCKIQIGFSFISNRHFSFI